MGSRGVDQEPLLARDLHHLHRNVALKIERHQQTAAALAAMPPPDSRNELALIFALAAGHDGTWNTRSIEVWPMQIMR